MSGLRPARPAAAPLAALLGFFSVAAQTILARELLVFFHGSELALGVVIAVWLLLGGAGSAVASRALRRSRAAGSSAFAAAAAAAALSLPAGVLGARWAAEFLPLATGVVPGVRVGALAALALLTLPAAAGGAWFAIAAGLWRDARGPGLTYAWESAGGLLGGAVIAVAFSSGTIDAFTLASITAAATLALASWIAARAEGRATRSVAAALAVLALLVFLGGSLGLAARSQAARWPGLELLAARDGRHGNAALTRVAGQVTLFANGEPALSFPDPESAEAAVHLPLLAAPQPARVLVTSEALGGGLAEVLKHPVTAVDCVVPDPDAVALLRPHLPPGIAAALDDPRVRLRHSDVRAWIARHPATYDAALLGSVEPASALANRLSTREFFELVRACLRPGGTASLSLTASPNHPGPELRLRNASVARALGSVFRRVEVLRPAPLTLLASDSPEPLADAGNLTARFLERRIAAETLSTEVIAALLEPARSAQASRELLDAPAAENRDAAPAAYLYHARYREAAADPPAAALLAALDGPARWAVFALPLLLALLAAPGRDALAARLRGALGAAAAVTGCGAMALQFLLLFVYQTARGLLYAGLGLLSGMFMGGLAAGSALALFLHRRGTPVRRLLAAVQGALIALPALAGAAFAGTLAAGTGPLPLAADLLAGAFAAACGLAGGLAFSLLTLSHPGGGAEAGGAYYAFDLIGSAAGALLASLWLLPLLGMPATLAFLALLHAASTLLLWRAGALAWR